MIFLLNGLIVIYTKPPSYYYSNVKGPGRRCKFNVCLFSVCEGNLTQGPEDLSWLIACYMSSAEAGAVSLWPALEKIYAR